MRAYIATIQSLNELYLAIIWRLWVAVNCGQIVCFFTFRSSVYARDVEQLLPGPLHGIQGSRIARTTATVSYMDTALTLTGVLLLPLQFANKSTV